ncbi:MAG TPA: pentapeptide repeat-containing protein [Anaerolineae bacterium]
MSNEFIDCLFSGCTFRETLFKNCRFHECVFSNCDLSLARVEGSSFSNTRFVKSRVIGINWTLASWPKYPLRPPIRFDECVLDYSTFIGLSLPGIRITGCRAKDVDFSEADLSEADFSKTDLSESRFGQTNLAKANFEDATNYTIDVHLNDVSKARFSLPEAVSLLRSLDIILPGRVIR